MMRRSGSVPLYRTTIRPRLPSAFSNSAWAFRNPFMDSSGTRFCIRMLWSICGKTVRPFPSSETFLPDSTMMPRSCSAASTPSPVVA